MESKESIIYIVGGKAEYDSNLIRHIFWGCSSPPPKPQPPLLKPNYHQALHHNTKGGGHSNILASKFNIFFNVCTSLRYISSFKSSIITIISHDCEEGFSIRKVVQKEVVREAAI